ncbi:MAG: efflux RND transporter periplasmic adaptor subunit [Planctomycetes bacterium]|nr:efflux RND transporter periplasmic adaptor subunit [Planctomycetota bacterium]
MSNKLILPLLAVVAFSFMSFHIVKAQREIPPQNPPLDPSRSPYNSTLAGAGIVEPRSENIAVGAHLPGIVTEVFVNVGDRVDKGTPLFQIDDRQQRAELAARQAQLDASIADLHRLQSMPRAEDLPVSAANVEKARADMKAQQDQMNRSEELFARKVTSAEDMVQRQQSFAAAKALLLQAEAEDTKLKSGAWVEDIAVARAQVERMKSQVQQTRVELDRLQVKAPISGAILKVDVRPGEFVGAPPGQELMVMGDVDVLHVRVDIDEQDLPRFRAGLSGRGFVRGDAQQPISLSFVRVEPYAQPKKSLTGSGTERVDTRVLQVIYAVEPIDRPLYVGQQIDVYLDAENP